MEWQIKRERHLILSDMVSMNVAIWCKILLFVQNMALRPLGRKNYSFLCGGWHFSPLSIQGRPCTPQATKTPHIGTPFCSSMVYSYCHGETVKKKGKSGETVKSYSFDNYFHLPRLDKSLSLSASFFVLP